MMQVFRRGIPFLVGLFFVQLTPVRSPMGVKETALNRTYLEVLKPLVDISPKSGYGHSWALVRLRKNKANRPLPLRPNETMNNPLYLLLGNTNLERVYKPLPAIPAGRKHFPKVSPPDPMRHLKPGLPSPLPPKRGPATPTRSMSLFANKALPSTPPRSKSTSSGRRVRRF
ncbi:uncharacterized protein LOC142768582 [Rhipicephalus microplus]|uniref:uncharacterized protein LOC142768582 n=1 Tax=Rhipicephalus microplus TaxID=6941 RepID=UPI003F6BD017